MAETSSLRKAIMLNEQHLLKGLILNLCVARKSSASY